MKSSWYVLPIKHCITALLLCLSVSKACPQALEVGPALNYFSNGILVRYEGSINKNLSYFAGFRYMINTTSITANKNADYQNGYAANFGQHLGLSAAIAQRIFHIRGFSCSAQFNVLVARHGSLRPFSAQLTDTGKVVNDFDYRYAALSVDATLGLRLTQKLSKKDALSFYYGVGIIWSNYGIEGRTFYTHIPSDIYSFPSGFLADNDVIQVIGITGIPSLALTYSHQIQTLRKLRPVK